MRNTLKQENSSIDTFVYVFSSSSNLMSSLMKRTEIEAAANARDYRVSHFGLFVDRYFMSDDTNRFQALFANQMAMGITSCDSLYQLAYERWATQFHSEAYKVQKKLKVKDRLVVGLGQESVNEIGLQVHHTYGVPYISGSAIKGTVAHYCHQVWGKSANQPTFLNTGAAYQFIFGSENESGVFEFHDAWLLPEYANQSIGLDIMTTHHSSYYQGQMGASQLMDSEEPNPIHFFSVNGTFLFTMTVTQTIDHADEAKKWLALVEKLLVQALTNYGIGGKKSTGYGRLIDLDAPDAQKLSKPSVSLHQAKIENGLVMAERVEDPKNQGRMFFKHPAGKVFPLMMNQGTQKSVEIGETTELVLHGSNFYWPDAPTVANLNKPKPKNEQNRNNRRGR